MYSDAVAEGWRDECVKSKENVITARHELERERAVITQVMALLDVTTREELDDILEWACTLIPMQECGTGNSITGVLSFTRW